MPHRENASANLSPPGRQAIASRAADRLRSNLARYEREAKSAPTERQRRAAEARAKQARHSLEAIADWSAKR